MTALTVSIINKFCDAAASKLLTQSFFILLTYYTIALLRAGRAVCQDLMYMFFSTYERTYTQSFKCVAQGHYRILQFKKMLYSLRINYVYLVYWGKTSFV